MTKRAIIVTIQQYLLTYNNDNQQQNITAQDSRLYATKRQNTRQ